jgi:hypothetical protein
VRIPTPALTGAEACDTWANYWMHASGADAHPASLEAFSNCRRSVSGNWIIPTGPQDPRLPGAPILSADEARQTQAARQQLLTEIGLFEARFPQSLNKQLTGIYSQTPQPVVGNIKDVDGIVIGPTRDKYTRLIQAFLMDPHQAALADYVGWLMDRKAAGFSDFQRSCHKSDLKYLWAACDGIANSLSVTYPPWPWELKDPLNLASYLEWALANGKLPPPASTPVAMPR